MILELNTITLLSIVILFRVQSKKFHFVIFGHKLPIYMPNSLGVAISAISNNFEILNACVLREPQIQSERNI